MTAARPRPTWSNRGGRIPLKVVALLCCVAVLSAASAAEQSGRVDPATASGLTSTTSMGVLLAGMVLVMTTPLAGLWLVAAGAWLMCEWSGAPWPLLTLAGVLTVIALWATVPVLRQLSASRRVLADRKVVTLDAASADALRSEHPGNGPRTIRLIVAAVAAGVAAFALTMSDSLAREPLPKHLVWGVPATLVPLLTLRWRASRRRRALRLADEGAPGLPVTLRGAGDRRLLLDGGPHLAATTGFADETMHLVGFPPGHDVAAPSSRGKLRSDGVLAGGRPEPGVVLGLRTADDITLVRTSLGWLAGPAPRDVDRDLVTGKIVPASAVAGVEAPSAVDPSNPGTSSTEPGTTGA